MNRVAVLGSTGSVGTQALHVARALRDRIRIVALAGGSNTTLLSAQIQEFRPGLFSSLLPHQVTATGARAASPEELASDDSVDTVLVATSGSSGLAPTLAALRRGKTVALASKEVMVMAGGLVTETARRYGGRLVPVDSEHSAIWQCLRGEEAPVRRLLLTASGGPFYRLAAEQLERVSVAETLSHPVWRMGKKITVDSATLMNKGLEVIEARWLFDVPFDRIEVLLHPQCLVHSMVEFPDGVIKAQASVPDMALPIQTALTYPDRVPGQCEVVDWSEPRTLTFEPVDEARFPCLRLAREAGIAGGTYPSALCGADEAAVSLFLAGQVPLTGIARLVEQALDAHHSTDAASLDSILAAERQSSDFVMAHHAGSALAGTPGPGAHARESHD